MFKAISRAGAAAVIDTLSVIFEIIAFVLILAGRALMKAGIALGKKTRRLILKRSEGP